MICIIPARAGSKRIPGKNMKDFLGKPIISYPIQTAIESKLFDKIIVAIDDEFIGRWLFEKHKTVTPYMREPENATDDAELEAVLYEVLENFKQVDYCCMLLPCAVFTTVDLLEHGRSLMTPVIKLKDMKEIQAAFPVVHFSYPPQRALEISNESAHFVAASHSNSQDYRKQYHDAGQFYWLNVDEFRMSWRWAQVRILNMENRVMILQEFEAQDIDTIDDWALAEMKYRRLYGHDNA